MLRLAVFAVLVAACSATSTNGIVEGLIPCGFDGSQPGAGTFLQARITDCTTLPCPLYLGKQYNVEVDFEPAGTHQTLFVRISVIGQGREDILVDAEVPAAVSPGNGYTVAYPWTVAGDIWGMVNLRIQLYNDQITELCGLATATIRLPSARPMPIIF